MHRTAMPVISFTTRYRPAWQRAEFFGSGRAQATRATNPTGRNARRINEVGGLMKAQKRRSSGGRSGITMITVCCQPGSAARRTADDIV